MRNNQLMVTNDKLLIKVGKENENVQSTTKGIFCVAELWNIQKHVRTAFVRRRVF